MGLGQNENVFSLAQHRKLPPVETGERPVRVREAAVADVAAIQALYREVYDGKYRPEYATRPEKLTEEIVDRRGHLWLVAEDTGTGAIAGAITFLFDARQRLGKAAGMAVLPAYRACGIGASLLKLGIEELTEKSRVADVIYATTRTINEAPSRLVEGAGFKPLGVFPNAVQVDRFEHLSLDVYLTEAALAARRKKPYLLPAFAEIYEIARRTLGLERAALVTERAPLALSPRRIELKTIDDPDLAASRFRQYAEERRLSNSFFPFQRANRILASSDGGSEVFLSHSGPGREAAILGYRTDRVNVHDLLDAVASSLQRDGAVYVELLVDAYDFKLQQEAFTARFLPSAYFPAMMLNNDGHRDDFFVVSRTFRLLDFTQTVMSGESLAYLRAYLKYYHDLYLRPILGH